MTRRLPGAPRWSRARVAGYALLSLASAFVFASIVTAGATKWLPAGRAGIDHIMVPIVAFPVVWVVFALVLYAARRRGVAWAAVAGLTAIHAALVAHGWAS